MNLLYLTHRIPHPPDKGDRIRNWSLLRFLAREHKIFLACLADEPIAGESERILRQMTERFAWVPIGKWGRRANALLSVIGGRSISEGMFHSQALGHIVREWAKEIPFDGAICSASSVANYLRIPELADAVKVVDLVDVDSRKWFDYAAGASVPKKWLYSLEGRRVQKLEESIQTWADGVSLVCENELDYLPQRVGPNKAKIRAVTHGIDLVHYQPFAQKQQPNHPSLIFVGAFDYKPNVDGAVWFCREIFPAIRNRHPGLTMQLVGRSPVAEVLQLRDIPGVEVVGAVPDVRPYVAEATLVVAPLRLARGIQNKVLEAWAMGKAVVSSPGALAGFKGNAELPALCAESAEQWGTHIDRLLNDSEFREELGSCARRYAETYHDWQTCLEPIREFFHSQASGEHKLPERDLEPSVIH